MIEKNEKYNGKKILLIFFIVLLLLIATVGIIVNMQNKINNNDKSSSSNSGLENQTLNKNMSLIDLLSESELKTDFKNIEKDIFNLSIVFNCESYNEKVNLCDSINSTINSDIEINSTYFYLYTDIINSQIKDNYVNPTAYKINDYLVFISNLCCGIDMNTIMIYNIDGILLYTNENVKSFYDISDTHIDYKPTIKNNILYFIEGSYMDEMQYIKYYEINLNSNKIESVVNKSLQASFSDER